MPLDPHLLRPAQERAAGQLGAVVRDADGRCPRMEPIASSSRTIRRLGSDVSATSAKHSRVKSSISPKMRKRRPSASASDWKSRLQR